MNRLNAAAFFLAIVAVVTQLLGQTIGIVVPQWEVAKALTAREIEQWVWLVRVLPLFAVHFGIALWLQDRAIADQREKPMLWGVFGLFFGLVAGLLYVACAIVQGRQQTPRTPSNA